VLIPAEEISGNDGVAQSRGRFAPWDAPEGPGSSVEGQADHRLPPGACRDLSCGVTCPAGPFRWGRRSQPEDRHRSGRRPIVRRGRRHLCKASTALGVTSRLETVGRNQ
jgi:hypothetical protein